VAVMTPELAEQTSPEVGKHQCVSATWLMVGSPASVDSSAAMIVPEG
jgi:hypothetical protein